MSDRIGFEINGGKDFYDMMERINIAKSWFLEKTNKMEKPFEWQIKKNPGSTSSIGNGKEDITSDIKEIF